MLLPLLMTSGSTLPDPGGWEGTPFSISSSPAPVLGSVGFDTVMAGSMPAGYSATGFTPTYSGGDLVINASYTSGAPHNVKNNNYVTLSEKNRLTLLFKLESDIANEYGIGVSYSSINPNGYAHSLSAYFYLVSSGSPGHVGIQDGLIGTAVATSVGTVAMTAGNEYRLVVERSGLTLTATLTNLTTSEEISTSYSRNPNNDPGFPNASKLQISSIGSHVAIHEFQFEVLEKNNLNLLEVGDSITYGQAATLIANRYAQLVDVPPTKLGVMGNGADCTAEVLAGIDEIIALAPKAVSLMIGGNDLLFAIPTLTWQSNLDAICSALRTAGIKIIHLAPTPRNMTDVLPLKNYITATYQQDFIITDTYDAMATGSNLTPAYDSGDGLHPNNAGMAAMATVINGIYNAKLHSITN